MDELSISLPVLSVDSVPPRQLWATSRKSWTTSVVVDQAVAVIVVGLDPDRCVGPTHSMFFVEDDDVLKSRIPFPLISSYRPSEVGVERCEGLAGNGGQTGSRRCSRVLSSCPGYTDR